MKHSKKEIFYASKMTKDEFSLVLAKNWAPIEIKNEAVPKFLSNIPKVKVISMFGSGSLSSHNPCDDCNKDRGQIGGIDVYRVAETEDGVKINKDWYAIFEDPNDSNTLYVIGPERDQEHWINDIPDRLKPKTMLADPNSFGK
jgi:hypothetical protein